jgi:two-component system, chemotaxis family, protein-glutamate methylesterase/glutaminase
LPSAVIAVAASAGGVEALQRFVSGLPADLDAAVLVVLHISPSGPSVLPGILARAGRLPARHPMDKEPLQSSVVIVAPPDRHLAIEDSHVRSIPGPRENGHRPSADVLMRSVADRFGRRSAGVILSGTMDDGAAGLKAIRSSGGLAVVQEPTEAAFPWMPLAAIEAADPQVVCPLADMGTQLVEWLAQLDRTDQAEEADMESVDPREEERRQSLSPFTCPECGGTLWKVDELGAERYRCRVGHAFSEGSLFRGKQDALESALWAAIVALEEKADLCRRISKRLEAAGQVDRVARYQKDIDDAEAHIEYLKSRLQDAISSFPAVFDESVGDG